jgi:hypothetical protein
VSTSKCGSPSLAHNNTPATLPRCRCSMLGLAFCSLPLAARILLLFSSIVSLLLLRLLLLSASAVLRLSALPRAVFLPANNVCRILSHDVGPSRPAAVAGDRQVAPPLLRLSPRRLAAWPRLGSPCLQQRSPWKSSEPRCRATLSTSKTVAPCQQFDLMHGTLRVKGQQLVPSSNLLASTSPGHPVRDFSPITLDYQRRQRRLLRPQETAVCPTAGTPFGDT